MSSQELQELLNQLEQEKKVTIYPDELSEEIIEKFNNNMAQFKLEYSKMEKESIEEASSIMLTA